MNYVACACIIMAIDLRDQIRHAQQVHEHLVHEQMQGHEMNNVYREHPPHSPEAQQHADTGARVRAVCPK